jgi:hypothetical protein
MKQQKTMQFIPASYFSVHPLSNIIFMDLFFKLVWWGWSPIRFIRHCGHQWRIVPAPGDYDNGEIGGMIGKGD